MATNWRYGGEALPYGQRDRKRPGEDFGQTGDGKRVNYYDKNNDNYKQERPPPLNDPRFHLATAPKEHPVYSVYQSPFNASHSSIGSARAGEFRMRGSVQDNGVTSHNFHAPQNSKSEVETILDSLNPRWRVDVPSPMEESRGIANKTAAVAALAEYSELIATRSALLTQHAQLKEKFGRIKSRNDRWQKHYGAFVTLAEDYERELESVTSEIALIDMKISQNGSQQDRVAHKLMLTLVVNSTPVPPKFEAEMESFKASMRDNRSLLIDLKEEVKSLQKASKLDDSELQFHLVLDAYGKAIVDMRDQLNKSTLRMEGLSGEIETLKKLATENARKRG